MPFSIQIASSSIEKQTAITKLIEFEITTGKELMSG